MSTPNETEQDQWRFKIQHALRSFGGDLGRRDERKRSIDGQRSKQESDRPSR